MRLRGIALFVVLTIVHSWHDGFSHGCIYFPDGRSSAFTNMTKSINGFSADLYKAVLNDPSVDGNFISSPLSVAMVLLMAGFGAQGSTAAELNRILHANENITECTLRTLTTELSSYTNVELSLANKIFANSRGNIKEEYQGSVEFGFLQEVERVDFSQPSTAVRKINDWCERQTHSRIKDLVGPDDVDSSTALVLVNAIYFQGKWAKPFKYSETIIHFPFYRADGTMRNLTMMFIDDEFRYGILPEIDARFIEIPYVSKVSGDNVSMFIILPDKHDGLHKVENNIHKIPLKTLQSGEMAELTLGLPKFKIESKIELTDILRSMGLKRIFTNGANFSGISDAPMKISKVVQKAFLEVDELGSEPAAATDPSLTWSLIRTYFRADHPFLVLIATEDIIVFSGRVTDPYQ